MNIAFIGLGAMGYPMAGHLSKHFPTLVYNRNPEKAVLHSTQFGSSAVSLTETARADVLFTCLPTTTEVQEIANMLLPHLKAGMYWVDCTSGDPSKSVLLAQQLAAHGVKYLDAPVSGGTAGAHNAELTVMIGGENADVEAVRPILSTIASTVVHVGEVGSGHAVKAINNMLLAINLLSAAEGLTVLKKLGVNVPAALQVINHSSGRSNVTQNLVPARVLTRDFPNTFALGLLAKDTGIAMDVAKSSGVATPTFALTDSLYKVAKAQIGADVDHSAVFKLLEAWAGVEVS